MIESMAPLFLKIRFLDVIDICAVALLLYFLYKITKGTVAIRIFVGIVSLYFVWKMVEAFQMKMLSEILGSFLGVGVVALLIVFQQEIRKFLLMLGTPGFIKKNIPGKFFFSFTKYHVLENELVLNIPAMVSAVREMAKNKVGALIVLTKKSEMHDIVSTGNNINADISKDLIENVFFKNAPLHDGALIITNNKLVAARCILPASDSQQLPNSAGLRHRAALGVSEIHDAFTIIISEETGRISWTENAKVHFDISTATLTQLLEERFELAQNI